MPANETMTDTSLTIRFGDWEQIWLKCGTIVEELREKLEDVRALVESFQRRVRDSEEQLREEARRRYYVQRLLMLVRSRMLHIIFNQLGRIPAEKIQFCCLELRRRSRGITEFAE